MKGKTRADDFLRAMTPEPAEPLQTETAAAPVTGSKGRVARTQAAQPATSSRAGLKHFGAYLDDDTLEKIALLRVRLKKDNSELTKLAIDELHAKHMARRAHGDA
jgi:hypothetical protein